MFDIYIKDFNQNGNVITQETLVQTIPAENEGALKLISPIVKNEMGKSEMLDFSIESGTAFYDAFLQMKTYIRIVYDGDTIFYGRVLTIDNSGFRGTRKIRCEGPLTFLLDSPVEGTQETGRKSMSVHDYMQYLISNHNDYVGSSNKNFVLGEVPGQYSNSISDEQKLPNTSRKYGSDSWTDTKSALEDLRSHYGGYFRTRAGSIGNNIVLDWLNHYFNSSVNAQTIEVGKNILDISDITEIDNVFTAIIPIGKGSGSSNNNIYIDGKVLNVPDICNVYSDEELNSGYHRAENYRNAINNYGTIIKTVSFDDATTKEKLYTDACEWIKNNYQGEVTKFTIKAIDMHQIGENTSKIMVGDQVTIIYPVGDENGAFTNRTTTLTCLNISYDLYHPENNSYTFGIPANILTKTYGLKRQSKSVGAGGVANSKTGGDGTGTPEDNTIGRIREWLMKHKIYYGHAPGTGELPYSQGKPGMNGGRYDDNLLMAPLDMKWNHQIYDDKQYLVKATKHVNGTGKNPPTENTPFFIGPDGEKCYPKGYTYDVSYSIVLAPIDSLTLEICQKYNVFEYVKYEYGVDLYGITGTSPGAVLENDDGTITLMQEGIDPETGAPEYVKVAFYDPSAQEIGFFGPDGEHIKAILDPDGNYHYWYETADGRLVETTVRDLAIKQIDTDRKVGWIVSENEQGDLGFANPGEMTLAIENYANGPLVVARFAGEEMYLGNYKTQQYFATSTNHMSQVTGDITYVEDPETHVRSMNINSGGGLRITHGKIIGYDESSDPPKPIYETDPETGAIVTSEFGVYDNNTLTGGMVVEKLNDGTTRAEITGSIINLNTNSDYASLALSMSGIRLAVEGLDGEVRSVIEQTESMISIGVASAASNIYGSVIEMTASYIRTEVYNAASAISHSVIEQTTDYIHTEVASVASGIAWAVVDQTMSEIRTQVGSKARVYIQSTDPRNTNQIYDGDIWVDAEDKRTHQQLGTVTNQALSVQKLSRLYGDIIYVSKSGAWIKQVDTSVIRDSEVTVKQTNEKYEILARAVDLLGAEYRSNLSVTAQKISSDVSTAQSRIYSTIQQTATHIRAQVANELQGMQSTIEQTAAGIRVDVSAAASDLYSVIEVTATQVFSGVYNRVSNNFSTITQTESMIDLRVGTKVGKDEIISSINQTAEAIRIQASKIELDGNTTLAGTLTITDGVLNVQKDLTVNGSIRAGLNGNSYLQATSVRLVGASSSQGANILSLTYNNMKTAIKSASVDGNILTLTRFDDTELTFRKATSLSGAWSGNTLTVTAGEGVTPYVVRPYVQPIASQGAAYADFYVATATSSGQGYDAHGNPVKAYLVKNGRNVQLKSENSTSSGMVYATISAQSIYDDGYDATRSVYLTDGNGSYYTTTTIQSGATRTYYPGIQKSDGTWMYGSAVSISAYGGGGGSASNIRLSDFSYKTQDFSPDPSWDLQTLNTLTSLLRGQSHGYVYFKATLAGGSGERWYRVPTLT